MRRTALTSVSTALLGLLLTVLTAGLPVLAETDHDDLGAHIESGHGGHGVGLLQQDQKVERATALSVATPETPSVHVVPPPPRLIVLPRLPRIPVGSRAPPIYRPRAPPPPSHLTRSA